MLYNAGVFLPEFIGNDKGVILMHGVEKNDDVHPTSPWVRARFRYDGESAIHGFHGILVKSLNGESTYLHMSGEIPEEAKGVTAYSYDSRMMDRLSHAHVKGKGVDTITIDRESIMTN